MKIDYDIDEIRKSPRNFVNLETVIWLLDRVNFLELQINACNLELNYIASALSEPKLRNGEITLEEAIREVKLYCNSIS